MIVSNTDTAPTLENAMGAGGNNIPMVLLVLEDQGGAVINWNHRQLSPTLRAQEHGHPPVVVLDNGDIGNDSRSSDS